MLIYLLQYDYAEDEPYRNMLGDGRDDDDASEDGQMQRDAASSGGVITEQKYFEVGNEKAVQQARDRYISEQRKPSKFLHRKNNFSWFQLGSKSLLFFYKH